VIAFLKMPFVKAPRPILALFLLSTLISCTGEKEPIKIGFVGGLSGSTATLGKAGQDGTTLAVEERNKAGGVGGRLIELLVKDDKQDALVARTVDEELIKEGVVGIVGHMTSSMSTVGAEVANQAQVLMMGPTTGTNALSGKADYFYRVYPATSQTSEQFARYICNTLGLKRASVVYDISNHEYTVTMYKHFKRSMETLGGTVVFLETFHSRQEPDFATLADKASGTQTDIIFIIANARDTALLSRELKKQDKGIPIIASEWASTSDIFTHGDKAVEGLKFLRTFDNHSDNPAYLAFKKSFVERFGYEPGFAAVHSYDSTHILMDAIANSTQAEPLGAAIVRIGTFKGLQGDLSFDRYGDIVRKHFLQTIKDGRFQSPD
jgi:branched-chain amino acid transport system substrate-binding protein